MIVFGNSFLKESPSRIWRVYFFFESPPKALDRNVATSLFMLSAASETCSIWAEYVSHHGWAAHKTKNKDYVGTPVTCAIPWSKCFLTAPTSCFIIDISFCRLLISSSFCFKLSNHSMRIKSLGEFDFIFAIAICIDSSIAFADASSLTPP